MKKEELLHLIAEEAYKIGYGAKLNFASYDILTKYSEYNSLVSISIGILGLTISFFSSKYVSTIIIIMGVIGLLYDKNSLVHLLDYDKCGKELTDLYNKTHQLYFEVKSDEANNLIDYEHRLNEISTQFVQLSISRQVLCSSLLAHQKFFCEMDIHWLDEELHFNFWKDKIPNRLKLIVAFFMIIIGIFVLYEIWSIFITIL